MRLRNLLLLFTFVPALIAMLGVTTGAGFAAPAGSDPGGRVIIVFKDKSDGPAREEVVRGAGGTVLKHLPLVNGAAVWLPSRAAERALRSRPDILRVEPDAVVQALEQTLPWGIDRIDADVAWSVYQGTGVKVAVIDTGIDLKHPDLKANIAGGYNAISPRRSPTDGNGHGTHVAGTIAAVNNTTGVVGAAPAARLYAVKALNDNGSGYISDIIEGIDWSIRNGMQVINMSLGTASDIQSFHDAVKRAYDAGITVVAAAGNSGPGENTVSYPARYPEVIAVAATDKNDNLAEFSSRGPEVDLAAPGVNIYSTYKRGTYKTLSGTSMAAPHVAGTAALVIQAWGAVSPDTLRQHLLSTATAVPGSPYPLVNAAAAVTTFPFALTAP